jgi:hypothetical protein
MEPLTTLAVTVASLFFGEAVKEAGKSLGQATTKKIAQITDMVRARFQKTNTEGLLIRAEQQPIERNITKVTEELEAQFTDDPAFFEEVQAEVQELEKLGFTQQEILRNAIFKGKLEVDEISQEKAPGSSGKQSIGEGLQVEGDAKFGKLSQKG